MTKDGLMEVFVINPDFFNYIEGDQTFLERELEKKLQKNN